MPSPTFTLLAPYVGADGRKLYHFDLYRLNSPEEYYAAGLDEFVGGDGIAVVEWPQKAEIQPTPALEIDLFRCADEQTRLIEIQNYDVAGFDPDALSEWRTEA